MVVAHGTADEINQMVGINIANKVDHVTKNTDDEGQSVEKHAGLVNAEQLHEAKEDRKMGSVSFKTYAKYLMHGAPAILLLLILLVIGASQGNCWNRKTDPIMLVELL